MHARGLRAIDAVAQRERGDAARARIAVHRAADHVVQKAFTHRGFADAHLFDGERRERGFEDRDTTSDHGHAFLGESGKTQVVDAACFDHRIAQARHRRGGDALLAPAVRLHDVADRARGAG